MNNLLLITFDSCRFDTFAAAKTPFIDRLGAARRAYSYASWTMPSHHVYLMGVSPHESPKHVFASEVYRRDFFQWSERLGIPNISFKEFVPQLSLPGFLKKHGYKTHGRVSLPVLNQTTAINNNFDTYKLMDKHNDFNAMLSEMKFSSDYPSFYFFNVGETHYPYTLPGESAEDLPRIHGVHGVFKHMDDLLTGKVTKADEKFFTEDQLAWMKNKQQTNVEYLDKLMGKLYDLTPPNTYIMLMSDHGECFGEEGYFGHGPVFHEKVFEVFMTEGMRP